MAATEVQICNMALFKAGNLPISSLDDQTKEGRACKVFYPLCRDELLAGHPWNFAMARADISAQLTTTPPFEWGYAYTLPFDCLRVWELYGSASNWVVEGSLLLTNQDADIYIRYIRRVIDSALFSPGFDNCLAHRLGAELAGKLADDQALQTTLLKELYGKHLPSAYALNAQEGNPQRHKEMQPLDVSSYGWQSEGR